MNHIIIPMLFIPPNSLSYGVFKFWIDLHPKNGNVSLSMTSYPPILEPNEVKD